MGAVDAPQQSSSRGRKGKRRKTRRLSFRLDMTPMVDVAFLLLTFFMLTTTFSKPNTMEINVPPESMEVKVAESNVLTLRIVRNDSLYWGMASDMPKAIDMYDKSDKGVLLSNALKTVLGQKSAQNDKLVVVIKLDKKARYRNLVDLIDELNLMKIDRFSLADFTDDDASEILKAKGLPADEGKEGAAK
jgi:biopolymer transport protein ExbD